MTMTALTFLELGLSPVYVDYDDAWGRQRELHASRVADQISDVMLLLEHAPVFTAGKRTEPHERPPDGTPVVDVDRGGKITWHGPGQLVGYPITKLPDHVYVVDFVRRLEEAMIRICADFGVETGRVKGRSGVWLAADPVASQRWVGSGLGRSERKVGAIGVRVSQKVTMHGFALNCDCALDAFEAIVPCGISDASVTNLSVEAGRPISVRDVIPAAKHHLADLLSWKDFDRSPDIARAEPVSAVGAVSYGLRVR
jgi:lipoyl(octanoyl) transferase